MRLNLLERQTTNSRRRLLEMHGVHNTNTIHTKVEPNWRNVQEKLYFSKFICDSELQFLN